MNDVDTIILGAGVAGLSAGAALARAGKSVLLFEARDRIGGRVHTVRDARWPMPMEFGAEFIHGRPAETWDIVHQTSLRAYDVAGGHWQSDGGKPVKEIESWPEVETVMRRLGRMKGNDLSFADFLTEHAGDVSEPARAMAKAMVEGLDAADAMRVSSQSLHNSQTDGDTFDADTAFRLFDGYDHVLDHLVRQLPADSIRLGTVVESIGWSCGRVKIRSVDGRQYQAARAVVTLPIGVLRAVPGELGAVRFDPPLPDALQSAIRQTEMGPVVKVLLRFHRPFWEDGDWRDLSFLHAPGAPFPTWWTMLPCRLPLLTAWAGGPAATAMSHRPPAEVLDAALHTLAPLLGMSESKLHTELVAWHVSDWQADPYARGAYAYAAVGGADAVHRLAEPVQGTLFFAGEATHPGYAGTVAAALASGNRVAAQMLGAGRLNV